MLVICTLSALNLWMVHCGEKQVKEVMYRASDGNAVKDTGEEMPIYPHP